MRKRCLAGQIGWRQVGPIVWCKHTTMCWFSLWQHRLRLLLSKRQRVVWVVLILRMERFARACRGWVYISATHKPHNVSINFWFRALFESMFLSKNHLEMVFQSFYDDFYCMTNKCITNWPNIFDVLFLRILLFTLSITTPHVSSTCHSRQACQVSKYK